MNLNRKKRDIIKINKESIIIKNNIYLIFLKQIFINQLDMKSFLLLSSQIEILKEFKIKNKNDILKIIEKILFRIIFIYITNIPFIVIKNNNFIFEE